MLALHELQADHCPGCGGVLSETTAAENEGAYQVDPPHRCHRCTALADAREPYQDPKRTAHPQALLWIARLRRR